MTWLLVVLLGLLGGGGGQPSDLGHLMETARAAFERRDFDELINSRRAVRLKLPDRAAGGLVRGAVASAALHGLGRRTDDVEIVGVGAAVVEQGHGYLELRRRFRVRGTAEMQTHRILISARWEENSWQVTEVWIAPLAPVP
ncbi:MAG: hypothetical protein KF785_10300 [Gemmatimonadales bacterium]|nr:hypothetical protein [Gemmatimonadales bacterium]